MSDTQKTEKSLAELGQEYEKHAQIQQSFIDNCKAEIKRAKMLGDSDAVTELQMKLRKLYEIKRELSDTASKLKTYYKKGEIYGE